MKTALAALACLVGMAVAGGPDTLWVRRLCLGVTVYNRAIASRGNAIAVLGNFYGGTTYDLLVARLNQTGDTVWTRRYDAGHHDWGCGVCIDGQSNVLAAVTSLYYKDGCRPSKFGPPGRMCIKAPTTNYADCAAVIAKYDSLGELKWLRTDTMCQALAVATDPAGNCYVTGALTTSDTSCDLWLEKLNPSGDTIWVRTYDFGQYEHGEGVAICADGRVAVCAYVGNGDSMDCLTLKLTPEGDTVWTRQFDRDSSDECSGIAIDRCGNIIVAGNSVSDTNSVSMVLKYDSDGSLLWSGIYSFGEDGRTFSPTCDSSGDIYVAGDFLDAPYLCLAAKLGSTGDTIWTTTYAGADCNWGYDVDCDTAGNPIVLGCVMDTAQLIYDMVIIKYSSVAGVAEPLTGQAARPTRFLVQPNPFTSFARVPEHEDELFVLSDVTGRQVAVCKGGRIGAGLGPGVYFLSPVGSKAGKTARATIVKAGS